MTRFPVPIDVQLCFLQPDGEQEDWVKGPLWKSAGRIPGVRLRIDPGGTEARYFGARTSGQALEKLWTDEYRFRRVDGSYAEVYDRGCVVHDRHGQPTRMIGAMMDISKRKETEKALAASRDEALESARLKSEFLANMSHEIRTPMNGVIGMTGLLFDTRLDETQREFVQTIRSSGDSLLTIINDILDLSKIEAGKLSFEIQEFALIPAVEDVLELLAESAGRKNLELIVEISPDLPRRMMGDPGRLRQVLTNLVGNATKFTAAGEVVLSAAPDPEAPPGSLSIRFSVRDTGIGISAEDRGHLFQAFSQVDASMARRYGGTGLGLVISKKIVCLAGGQIGCESEPGKKSVFWFTMPFQPSKEAQEEPLLPRGSRALVVEENQSLARSILVQLQGWGLDAVTASTAADAVRLLRNQATAGAPFHVIILDPGVTHLPEALAAEPSAAKLPLVLLNRRNRLEAMAHPAWKDHPLVMAAKPVRISHLFSTLVGLLVAHPASARHRRESLQPASQPRTAGRLRVLVVEDTAVNQRVALHQLEKLGHRADAVGNGREAVKALEKIRYDMVLMDCQMPEMDGYQATAEIRRLDGEVRHTPIIAMTAHALDRDREKCLQAGMDDYMSKPVELETLRDMIERHGAASS